VPEESQWYRGSDAYQQTHLDNRLGFAGYVWDPWLKVYHVRHRVYDPFDTRWLQADPIGYAGGDTDLRRYCNGDPINYIDPLGLCGGAGGTDEYWNNRHENRPGGTPDDTLHRSIITIIGTTNNLFGPQWNQKIDNGLNAVGSRLVGASRMCGGGAAGIGTGGLGAAFAADQIVAGARQVVTGEAADSALNQLVDNGLQGYGVDPDTAKTIANGSEIAAGLGLGIQQASRQAATRAAAEGAEAGASTGANAADDAAKAPSSGTGTTAAEKGGGAGKSPGQAGKEGEAMVPGKKNTDQIGSPSGDKKYRVPDRLDDEAKTLGEIKNVDKQSLTSQLRDYSAWAKENGYTAELWLRSDTKVSGPLQRAFDCGDIIRRDIPFTAPTAP
jgi:RHS repeat-associated protein